MILDAENERRSLYCPRFRDADRPRDVTLVNSEPTARQQTGDYARQFQSTLIWLSWRTASNPRWAGLSLRNRSGHDQKIRHISELRVSSTTRWRTPHVCCPSVRPFVTYNNTIWSCMGQAAPTAISSLIARRSPQAPSRSRQTRARPPALRLDASPLICTGPVLTTTTKTCEYERIIIGRCTAERVVDWIQTFCARL